MIIDWSQVSSLIVAIGTAALAIYAALTFRGFKDQMRLLLEQAASMKRQADAMDKQSKFIKDQSDAMTRQAKTMDAQFDIIREESATMKRQANAMEGQSSLMHENMEYDRSVKKYERVKMEMANFVGPLFAGRKDATIFSLKYKRSRRIHLSPTARVPDPSPDALVYDYVSFWDSIEQNMYLNSSFEFQLAINNYLINIFDYFQAVENGADQKRKKDLSDLFDRERKPNFIREIEKRYLELSNELKEIECELGKKKTKGC